MATIDMRPFMGNDLAGVFTYDFPDTIIYQGKTYQAIIKDRLLEEQDEFGGPVLVNVLEIHVLHSKLSSVTNGQLLTAKGEEKIIKNNMQSEDGNELIITVKKS